MEAAICGCPGAETETRRAGRSAGTARPCAVPRRPDSSPGQPRLLPANSRRMEGAEPPAEEVPDPRVQRLLRCAARALRLPAGRGAGGGDDAAAAELRAFAAGAAGRALLAWRDPAGRLALGPPPPPAAAARPKALFFLRPPGPGEPLCGDLPADALQHFAALVEEVRQESGAPGRGAGSAQRRCAVGPREPRRPSMGSLHDGLRRHGTQPGPRAPPGMGHPHLCEQPRACASRPLGEELLTGGR